MGLELEQIFEGIKEIKRDILELKNCFHEDFLELSDSAKNDIEESRKELRQGKRIPFAEVKRKAGLQ